jgi:hypothetical protein
VPISNGSGAVQGADRCWRVLASAGESLCELAFWLFRASVRIPGTGWFGMVRRRSTVPDSVRGLRRSEVFFEISTEDLLRLSVNRVSLGTTRAKSGRRSDLVA